MLTVFSGTVALCNAAYAGSKNDGPAQNGDDLPYQILYAKVKNVVMTFLLLSYLPPLF